MQKQRFAVAIVVAIQAVLVSPFSAVAQRLPRANPESVGMSSERFEHLDAVMQRYIDANMLAGSVSLVARQGKVVHLKAQGDRYIEGNEPMTDDAIFVIMSMTKPIVSTALMMLFEEGYFLLDDPISKYLPEFSEKTVLVETDEGVQGVPADRPITFRHVLSHTAGVDPARNLLTPEEQAQSARKATLEETIVTRAPLPLAFLPDGSFYLGDGYWNSRIIKYNADGEYVMEWGELGSGPGQFDLVHGVAVDRDRRVYVGDRTNNRIQVFTENGDFIEEWPDISDPVGVFIDENDGVWVISARLNRILKYSLEGELQYYLGAYGGTRGGFAGGLSRPHQLDVDQEGNLYIASWDGGWMDKFVPKPDADPSKLIGRSLVLTN